MDSPDPLNLLQLLQAAFEEGNATNIRQLQGEIRKLGVELPPELASDPGDDNSYTNPDGYAGEYRYYDVEPVSMPKKPVAGENQRGEGAAAAAKDAAQRQYNRSLEVQKAIADEQKMYNEGVQRGTGNHPLNR